MELLFFYLLGCPYCRRAEGLIAELLGEHPEYEAIPIHRVDETAEPGLVAQYDYWRVPSFYLGDRKLYEADPAESPSKMRERLNGVLAAAAEHLERMRPA